MKSCLSMKVSRVFLAVSVSLWMAGAGCMWGCSNNAMASNIDENGATNSQPSVATHSCHSRTHDCCAKKSHGAAMQRAEASKDSISSALPQATMSECPLAVNANAEISKTGSDTPDPANPSIAGLPKLTRIAPLVFHHSTPIEFLNRGPTHLLCCVFLI